MTMTKKTTRHNSEAKYSRIDRDHVSGVSKWHALSVRRFHRSVRQDEKRHISQWVR